MITIEKIIGTLNEYIVDLKYSIDKNHIVLERSNENGFDISIYFDPRESMIYFGSSGFHDHFDHTRRNFEELIEMLISSLVGYSRIIEYHWDGKVQRFKYQEIEKDESWTTSSKMSFPKWKFWKRHTVVEEFITQNNYLLRKLD